MEQILTKYFWVLNLITLAVMAFFLADGTSEIVATKVAKVLPEVHEKPKIAQRSRMTPSRFLAPQNGNPILERNIFDSITGPITDVEDDVIEDDPPLDKDGLPLVPCPTGKYKLLATVASQHSVEWSFASVAVGKDRMLYRIGDTLDNREVSGITWRYLFLMGSSDECYVDMFDDGKGGRTVARTTPKTSPEKSGKDDDFKNKIQSVSDTEKNIDRSVVDNLLSDPTKFIRSVRVRPHRENGKVVGFKLRRFKSGSPLELLGAKRGDIIHSVNGSELTSVDKALSAYQGLRSSGDLTFSLTRGGKPMEIKVNIR